MPINKYGELKMKAKEILEKLGKYKYPLIVLIIGLILISLPSGSRSNASGNTQNEDEQRLSKILESCEGVGKANVLLSENGAVIVCDGAADPEVRLNIINATEAFTGLGCDEIQVLKTMHN